MEIVDYDGYTSRMHQSIKDKLFFLDKVKDIDTIFDYGCADGFLLKEISNLNSSLNLIGYDKEPKMISLAKDNVQNGFFDESFCKCKNNIKGKSLLILSSVIHEVYSYSTPQEIELFWHQVFNSGFNYIAIRDLCVGHITERPVNMLDLRKIKNSVRANQLEDYENTWGNIRDEKNMLHFLLKYRYEKNWDRELRENYLHLPLEELLSIIPTDKYEIIYFNHYLLPFTRKQVEKDFGISLTDNTHVQILLKRR